MSQATILVVDDDPRARKLVQGLLEAEGYAAAAGGAEALALCEQHGAAIRLLVADLHMPAMSGVELADRVAARRPGVKALYMSGHPDTPMARLVAQDPARAFLDKLQLAEELAPRVRVLLGEPGGEAP